ncbi:beta strand repeat-containing protein [Brevibacillus ginsengisoli]|uniref:beta strand repeat-containing protein n=1 Tax=Brevibacillus ginsengisoli TaxID=363854 RepID=UPI003CFAD041
MGSFMSRYNRTFIILVFSLIMLFANGFVSSGNQALAAGTWTANYAPGVTSNFWGVAYGGGQFIAVSDSATIATSPDGVGWTAQSVPFYTSGSTITYSSGGWLAAGDNGNIYTLTNGTSWTIKKSFSGFTPYSAASYGGTVVFVGFQGTKAAILSTSDGINWNNTPVSALKLYGVTYGGGQFIAVGEQGAIYSSPDGVAWTQRTSGTTTLLNGISFGQGMYVAVGNSGQILTSTDGVAWAKRDYPTTTPVKDLYGITYGANKFIATGDGGTIITSPNGITWESEKTPAITNNINAVTFGNGRFVVVGDSGITANQDVSTDANLSNLTVSAGTLSPAFSSGGNSYTASVSSLTSYVHVTPTPANSYATVKVNGNPIIYQESGYVTLNYGSNTISVNVTAQDGVTTKTFNLIVTRAAPLSSNANLSNLALNAGTLSPTFAQGTLSYTTNVNNAVANISVTPTVADSTATVKVNGNAAVSGSPSTFQLNVGPNTITVDVSAQDGTTSKKYTVVVNRADSLPTISSQNFDSIPAGTRSSINGSLTFDGMTYSTDATGDQLVVDTIANIAGGFSSLGSGNGLSAIWAGTNTGTFFQFAAANSADNFKLLSFNAEVMGHISNNSQSYTLIGYDNNLQKATATVNFAFGGTYGTGNSTVSYTRLSTPDETSTGGNCGTLTFSGSDWDNIDQVKMIVADALPNTILFVAIDDLKVDVPVVVSTYTLNYTAGANGTITGTTSQTVNSGGNGTTVTAVPNEGFHFVSWSDGKTTASRTDRNVTSNLNVTATFAMDTYTLTYAAGANGTISGTASQTVNSGGNGTPVTAVPDIGYHFVSWSDGKTTASRTDRNVTSNLNVTANFAMDTYTLTYAAGANGTINGTASQTVNSGGNATTVTAVPDTGYHFVSWSDGVTTASRTDKNVTADLNVTANFAINTYTLDYVAGANGTISGTASQTVNSGGNGTTVTAVPDAGYHFVSWSDGVTTASRTDKNVTENLNVTANFAINTYTLNYAADANGTISGTTSQTVNSGQSGTTVTAVPNTGYYFVSWSDGVTTASRTDKNVTADLNVTANFAINTYTLNYAADANGTISGTTSQTVNSGQSGTTVTAVPNTGYYFVSWSDGVTTASRTDKNITADLNVTANFAINTYTLNYAADANGTISGTTSQTVNSGQSGTTVTAVPDTGYYFVGWSDGVTTATRTDKNVTTNLNVTANFAINTYNLNYAADANGTISGTTSQTVNSGQSGTTVTAVPDAGYHFVSWSDGVTTASRTDKNITADLNVTANFAINTYTLNYVAGSNGTITGTTLQTVNRGENGTTVTAEPNTGYHFESWSDGVTTATRTDKNVTANLNVTANFAINTYTADLSNLTISQGTLTPAFAKGTTKYTAEVSNAVTSTDVTPTTADGSATLTINGSPSTSGNAKTISLRVGTNLITMLVTTPDGKTKTYTITVERKGATPPPYYPPPVVSVTGVSLDQNHLTLQVGTSSTEIHATITPANATNQQVRWSSSDTGVATVDQNGVISALAAGETTISVSTIDGNYSASCSVKVGEEKQFELKASEQHVRLKPNKSMKFDVYAVYPDGKEVDITSDKNTTYSSSSSVVTVKPGTIKAGKKEGVATVTVSFEGKTTEIAVKVSKAEVKELVLPTDHLTLEVEATKQLEATAKLTNGTTEEVTQDAQWSSDDTDIVQVDAGKLTAVAPGKATVRVSYAGKEAKLKVDVIEEKALKRLTVNRTSVKLAPSKQYQIKLTAYYQDNSKTVITDQADWTTSDEQIATVEKGVITAIGPGKATIQASYKGKKVLIKVTVVK